MSRYVFGQYVEGDLIAIRGYIAQDSPDSATRTTARFVAAFQLPAKQPFLGHVREDLKAPEIRFWPVGNYLILYLAKRTPIEIVAVIHGARDIPAIVNRPTV